MPRVDFPQTYCLGAIARRDITPPLGIYHRMWGAATHDRATGIHRPLMATVLALQPGNQSGADGRSKVQVIVSIDHCLLWSKEMDALRRTVAQATSLELDQLHITFTHTHAAGLMDPARADLPGGELIAPYLDLLAERAGQAVSEALEAIRPVRIVYGTARCSLAQNRDFWDAEHRLFACGFNPSGTTDDTVLVARITDEAGRNVGAIVNYACHPTTLAWDNTLISPDFVGAMREVVETATGVTCLFLQGASGDLGPREGYVGDVAVADRNGRQLGYAALAALEALPQPGIGYEYAGPVISGATIGTWKYVPLAHDELVEKHRWHAQSFEIPLAYRAGLPTRADTEEQLADWQSAEQAAHAAGDSAQARDCRAQAERMQRQLARIASLPTGDRVPLAASLWQLGDAFWVMLAGEHYNLLQRALRERFASNPLIITTVTDGWLPGYVPTAETYGRGIYQESIAIAAPGSLEQVIDTIGARIAALVG